MSLAVAVPFGVASAVVYGTSIVIQHRVAQEQADDVGPSAAGLLRLLKHPTFLLAIGGDFIGFLLQLVALSTGEVVVVQPLVVLMLPVALLVAFLLGGHRPRLGDYLGVVAILSGLAVFLAMIGHPTAAHVPHPRYLGMTIGLVLIVGSVLAVAVTGRNRTIRGAVYGAAAGACFGTLAVMIDAASERLSEHGVEALFDGPRGLVPVVGSFVVGTAGMILTQMSFQVGALGATLPANLAVDPAIAVVLGAIVLKEHVSHSTVHIVAYVLCLAAVVAGAIRLANPDDGPLEPDFAAPTPGGGATAVRPRGAGAERSDAAAGVRPDAAERTASNRAAERAADRTADRPVGIDALCGPAPDCPTPAMGGHLRGVAATGRPRR